jgi:hypothetical protein
MLRDDHGVLAKSYSVANVILQLCRWYKRRGDHKNALIKFREVKEMLDEFEEKGSTAAALGMPATDTV